MYLLSAVEKAAALRYDDWYYYVTVMKNGGLYMNFTDIHEIKDETQQIQAIYQVFNEDTRLNHSRAARVEFLTTVRYIEKYLTPGMRILDIGAGAGEYSLYFARRGYEVCALELADRNIETFRKKLCKKDPIELVQGNAVDLSRYGDESFDVVLVLGPLYHLHSREAVSYTHLDVYKRQILRHRQLTREQYRELEEHFSIRIFLIAVIFGQILLWAAIWRQEKSMGTRWI